MEARTGQVTARPEVVLHRLEPEPRGWLSWLTTTDHKRIGIMYLVLTVAVPAAGGVEALLIRSQLAVPDNTLVDPETYNGARLDARLDDDLPRRSCRSGPASGTTSCR